MTKDSPSKLPDKLPDKPPEKLQEETETLSWKLHQFLQHAPKIKGCIVITYTIILLAFIAAYFTPILHLDKQILLTFSNIIADVFAILLAAFIAGYIAVLSLAHSKISEVMKIPSLDVTWLFGLMRQIREFRNHIIVTMFVAILLSVILVFFYNPLSTNQYFITGYAFTILEVVFVAVWFLARVSIEVARALESFLGGKR